MISEPALDARGEPENDRSDREKPAQNPYQLEHPGEISENEERVLEAEGSGTIMLILFKELIKICSSWKVDSLLFSFKPYNL